MGGSTRYDGLDEEGLLAVALLIAAHDAEAPALTVGLQQDDVSAPVHVTADTTNNTFTSPLAAEGRPKTTLRPASRQKGQMFQTRRLL